MSKIIISIIIVVVSLLSVACVEVEERRYTTESPCYHEPETESEALSVVGDVFFDLERDDNMPLTVYNSSPIKRMLINFYVEDNELLLHDWVFDVTISSTSTEDHNYDVVDWKNTLIRLNGEILYPEIEIIESNVWGGAAILTVKVTWVEKTYRSLYGENNIEIDFVFSEDLPVFSHMTLWTKSMLFKEVATDDYYEGYRDVNLGKEAFSGVLSSAGNEEQHFIGGFPGFTIED